MRKKLQLLALALMAAPQLLPSRQKVQRQTAFQMILTVWTSP